MDRDDWRTCRADRMSLRSPDSPRITPRALPGGDVAAYVSGQFHGGQPGAEWACHGSAVVPDPVPIAPYLLDGALEALEDGRGRVHLGAWSWPTLAATFARFDVELADVQPVELREAFATLGERARRAADTG